ncbi:spore coat U domain-containing protein [Salipiger sp.]|uniref:Csu type fimbrial protein n=1 Tax=Salipiger sp. TaxID=2078585 RepID=UPI003A977A31
MMLRLALVLLLAMAAFHPGAARAESCEAQVSDLSFGAVSLRSGAVNRSSGTIKVTCSNALVSAVGVCLRFGAGSGGAGANNNPRYLRGGGQGLAYQLRLGGYGNAFGVMRDVYMLVPIVLGRGSATLPFYGEILSTGTAIPTGAYDSVFSGAAHVEMSYGILSCDLFGQSQPVPAFRVSAEAVASCELDVGSMNFGRINGLGAAPADATAAIDIRCTAGTPYSVTLGMGRGGGSDPAARRMFNGLGSLTYGLFRDAARALPWGTAPGQTVSGSGAGGTQRYEVFGRIYQGQTTSIGTYTDSVIVTVNY